MTEPSTSPAEPLEWKARIARLIEFRPRDLIVLGVLAAVIVSGAAFAFFKAMPRAEPGPVPEISVVAAPSPTTSATVHVAGAVARPGVYSLMTGARVADAIAAAGGTTADADANAINLARPVTDGERIWVPRRGETPPPVAGGTSDAASGGKVNINTASASELDALPGIGPALAARIIDYRTKRGPFRSVRDLLNVEGIGDKKFEGLQDLVTV